MNRNKNWIAGAWSPAASGHSFASAHFGKWPRSDAEDVAHAIEGFDEGQREWRAMSPDARADVLGELLDLWEDEGEFEEDFAEDLGLAPESLEGARAAALELGDEMIAATPQLGEHTPVLARACAASLGSGLVRAVFPALLDGRALLLLSDADAPPLAAGFCELLDEVGVPRGLVSLLHDDASTCARAALATERFGRVALVESDERASRLAKWVRETPHPEHERGARFGSGAIAPRTVELLHMAPAQTTRIVRSNDDPRRAAREVCDDAFGAPAALSGQAAGRVGRVLCHERHVSQFTAELLAAIDALPQPCALFDADLVAHVEQRSRLGLDEGATLIRGSFGTSVGSRRRSRDAILAPSVFTNAEPVMALAKANRPAPILTLLRLGADAEAEELARSLG